MYGKSLASVNGYDSIVWRDKVSAIVQSGIASPLRGQMKYVTRSGRSFKSNFMRYRLRTLLIVLALGPIVLAGLFFGPGEALWDGRFPLNVCFVNETGKVIGQIEAAAVHNRAEADAYLSLPAGGEQPRWQEMELDNKGCAVLNVNCSGRTTWLGYERKYYRQGALVVRVKFDEGTQSLIAADIPPQREIRDIVVHIPQPN
jgi:hypothetical protein